MRHTCCFPAPYSIGQHTLAKSYHFIVNQDGFMDQGTPHIIRATA